MLTTKYGNGATIKSSHFVDLLIFFFSFCNCLDLAMMRQEPVIGDCLLFVYFDHFFFSQFTKRCHAGPFATFDKMIVWGSGFKSGDNKE